MELILSGFACLLGIKSDQQAAAEEPVASPVLSFDVLFSLQLSPITAVHSGVSGSAVVHQSATAGP